MLYCYIFSLECALQHCYFTYVDNDKFKLLKFSDLYKNNQVLSNTYLTLFSICLCYRLRCIVLSYLCLVLSNPWYKNMLTL